MNASLILKLAYTRGIGIFGLRAEFVLFHSMIAMAYARLGGQLKCSSPHDYPSAGLSSLGQEN